MGGGTRSTVVNCKFRHGEPLRPVVLAVVNKLAEVLLNLGVLAFCLAISLQMPGSCVTCMQSIYPLRPQSTSIRPVRSTSKAVCTLIDLCIGLITYLLPISTSSSLHVISTIATCPISTFDRLFTISSRMRPHTLLSALFHFSPLHTTYFYLSFRHLPISFEYISLQLSFVFPTLKSTWIPLDLVSFNSARRH